MKWFSTLRFGTFAEYSMATRADLVMAGCQSVESL
jgi:hypothetical protein